MHYVIVLSATPVTINTANDSTSTPKTFYLGVDGGCFSLLKQQLPLDLAIGDFDSLDPVCFNALKQTKTKIYQVPADNKDLTDFELVLDWLLQQKEITAITVYGWNGGRTDHFLSIISVFSNPRYAKLIPVMTLVDDINEISAIYASKPYTKQLLPKAAFKYIGFYAVTNLEGLTLTGFKYNLPRCNVRANTCYVSNEFVADNPGQVSLDAGTVLVIYSRA